MQVILKFFLLLLFRFRRFGTLSKLKKVNKKLERVIKDLEVEKIILKGRIIKMCRKFLNVKANSKYIPKTNKNETEVRLRILAEYGDEMKRIGVKIKHDLTLV